MNWPWETLGLNGPAPLDEIRRAYAERLRTTRPEDDPDGFQQLNQAYRHACQLARRDTDFPEDVTPDFPETDTPLSAVPNTSQIPDTSQNIPADRSPELPHSPVDRSQSRRTSRSGRPQSPDNMVWDYERLFAEGEAEERGLRFVRALELRRINQKRYQKWMRSRAASGRTPMDDWHDASENLRVIETLYAMDAALPLWREFLHGIAFSVARDNPDFVFGLEAFLSEHPAFPVSVRKMFYSAFAFRKSPRVRQRYRPLYALLRNGSDGENHSVRARLWKWITSFGKLPLALAAVLIAITFIISHEALSQAELKTELTGFAAEWGYTLRTGQTKRLFPDETMPETWKFARTAYFLEMPLTGAGNAIDALGELFDEPEKKNLFRKIFPLADAFTRNHYVLYLCWKDWCFYATQDSFDAQAARSYYEQRFGADVCSLIAERTGAARHDMGTERYIMFSLPAWGENTEKIFFHAVALPTSAVPSLREMPLFHYLLSADGQTLFCISGEQFRQGMNPDRLLCEAVPESCTAEGFPDTISVYRLSARTNM